MRMRRNLWRLLVTVDHCSDADHEILHRQRPDTDGPLSASGGYITERATACRGVRDRRFSARQVDPRRFPPPTA